jgi:mono/diheme cytochrome c family protein
MSRILGVAAAILMTAPAIADEQASIMRGKALVTENCSGCHAIGFNDKSPNPKSPPFRTLSQRYPLDALEEAFVEGIDTGHPEMPRFVATPDQIAAVIAYIATLNP